MPERNTEQQRRLDAGPVDVNAQVRAATTEHSAPTQSGDVVENVPPNAQAEPRLAERQREAPDWPPYWLEPPRR